MPEVSPLASLSLLACFHYTVFGMVSLHDRNQLSDHRLGQHAGHSRAQDSGRLTAEDRSLAANKQPASKGGSGGDGFSGNSCVSGAMREPLGEPLVLPYSHGFSWCGLHINSFLCLLVRTLLLLHNFRHGVIFSGHVQLLDGRQGKEGSKQNPQDLRLSALVHLFL
jgi:hypothetical protein